jgi:lyso-ornithine lipid O-acyltransferase
MGKNSWRTVARMSLRSAGVLVGTGVMMQSARAHGWLNALCKREHDHQWWLRSWAKVMLASSATRVQLTGVVPSLPTRARLIVANHRTPLDIPLLMSIFGGRVLSKSDVERLPILGAAATWAGTIFVDREDGKSGARAIRELRKALKSRSTVCVFPEGTTHHGDLVRPFRSGAFAAARGLDVEIIPVGIAYDPGVEFVNETFSEHLSRIAERRLTRASVSVGPALLAESSAATLAQSARDAVQDLVGRARRQWQLLDAESAYESDPLLPVTLP